MPWHHKLHRGGNLTKTIADIGGGGPLSGVGGLPRDLTINGITVSPTFRYEGRNASLSDWTATVGETLTAGGSGGSVGLGCPTPNDVDRSVNGKGARYWTASNNTFSDITTEDYVLELVGVANASGVNVLYASKRASVGWYLLGLTNGAWYTYINDGSTFKVVSESSPSPGAWSHVMVFADRSGSISMYVNGVIAGTPVDISSVGPISVAVPFAIGASWAGASPNTDNIAYAAMWQRSDWLDTHLQADLAAERFARPTGVYVPFWGPTDFSVARNSAAVCERQNPDGVQQLYTVGPRWPRIDKVPDKYLRYRSGFYCEGQHTNLLTYSEKFDNAAWVKTRATIDPNTGRAPDGKTTMDTVVEDGTVSNTHFAEQTFAQTAAAHVFIAVVEAIGRSWVQLEIDSTTDGAANAYIDVSSGAIGDESGNDASGSRYLGGGLYLVWLADTRSTAETGTVRIYAASGNAGRSYNGLSIDAFRVWGAMVVAGVNFPVSYVNTEGATVTRLGDGIEWNGLSLPTRNTIAADVLSYGDGLAAAGYCSLNDGTSNNRNLLFATATQIRSLVVSGGVSQGTVTSAGGSASVGEWFEARGYFDTDDVRLLRNGELLNSDSSNDVPATLSEVNVGGIFDTGLHADARVRVRVLSKPSLKNITDFGDIMSGASLSITTPAAVAQSTSYVNVGGTFTEGTASEFTTTAAGVATYTGTDTKRFAVFAACSGAVSTGTPKVTTVAEKNGSPVTLSESTRKVGSADTAAWACIADVELANGDTINMATKVDTGTPDLTMDKLSLVIIEVS